MVNATHYGHAVSAQTLVDNDGAPLATVTQTCGSWYIGTDTDGVVVAIDGDTGDVRSHGMFHAGNLASKLPERVVTPVALR